MYKELYEDIKFCSKKYVYLIPPLHILFTLIVTFIDLNNMQWVKLGNSTGYSIMTGCVYIVLFVFNEKYCLFTRISAFGLFLISILNTVGSFYFTTIEDFAIYEKMHSKSISFLTILLTIIYLLTKKK